MLLMTSIFVLLTFAKYTNGFCEIIKNLMIYE